MTADASLRAADDAAAMRSALELAARSLETGDVPVGAVVLAPDGAALAGASNRREALADPTGHAEIVALRAAGDALGTWRLTDCTLVVTLEPCTMCAGAVVNARVGRLVYGAADLKAGGTESLYGVCADPRLNHNPPVIHGVRAEEASAQLARFFAQRRAV